MTPRDAVEVHAAECRAAAKVGAPALAYTGPSLSGANLAGAYLYDADLCEIDLSDADLTEARLSGASLAGARLCGANLVGAHLSGTDLAGADLTGAHLPEGTALGKAIGDFDGDYWWWAVLLRDGSVLLQYGCERHTLDWWREQGPELSVRHEHPNSHWEKGPMVAIAAAEALLRSDR